jgi:hypothetical protein
MSNALEDRAFRHTIQEELKFTYSEAVMRNLLPSSGTTGPRRCPLKDAVVLSSCM